jgi:hypothetical protein
VVGLRLGAPKPVAVVAVAARRPVVRAWVKDGGCMAMRLAFYLL